MALNLGTIAVMPARGAGIRNFLQAALDVQVVDARTSSGHDGQGGGLVHWASE